MKYMLDTNICIYLLKRKQPLLEKRIRRVEMGDIIISSIVAAELQYGVSKSQYIQRNQANVDLLLGMFPVIDFDAHAAHYYGEVRTQLERDGLPIGSNDYLIAAHALATQTTLLTNNGKEFQRIPALKHENWCA